jgi:uncharacterized membrane protein YecN with MAPEG domain
MAAGMLAREAPAPIAIFGDLASAASSCHGAGLQGAADMPAHILLPITLTLAGAATLLNIWIAQRVGQMRRIHKVSIGDGGAQPLTARMRAHANFVEYTPFFLILIGLIELAKGSALWLWGVGIVFILARIVHVFGMDRPPGNRLRMMGIVVSALILIGLAAYALALPYLDAARPASITYA